jgi:hypothetical protein
VDIPPAVAAIDLWFQRAARLMFRQFESGRVQQYQLAHNVEDGPGCPWPPEEAPCESKASQE